jgi:tRNA (guanine-N7-)-methyltransferase
MEIQELKHSELNEIRTFGRRHGKKLSLRKVWLMENLLPQIAPNDNLLCEKSLVLEIGFGNGEHLRELALSKPESVIIGAEPFANGVAALLSAITNESDNKRKQEYLNIRVFPDDVRLMFKKFENLMFDEIWILHPDPWPKAKHEKRRLLNHEFLNTLARHLARDGKIIIGTDHWEYFDWIKNEVKRTSLCEIPIDMKTIHTRYQIKNKAGTDAPKYLCLANQ